METRYSYDPATRRLASLRDRGPSNRLQNNTYTYDNVGNITAINDGGLNPRSQSYNYDDANRLIASTGTMTINGRNINYGSDYGYSPAGRMKWKTVNSQRINNALGVYNVNYKNHYSYGYSNPFAVKDITELNTGDSSHLSWDANGNLKDYSSSTNAERHLCWTEDNRLQGYYGYSDEEGKVSAWYNYTADGNRNFKFTSPQMNMQQNAQTYSPSSLVYPTLYASPLITISKYGYTKHYFEGENRICSKIGGGFHTVSMEELCDRVPELEDVYDHLIYIQKEGVDRTFRSCLELDVDMDDAADLLLLIKYARDHPQPHEPAFFYHSDHLGSAAYLTNENGQVTQTLNYLPYGEDWADIQNQAETQYPMLGIYNYNGKEKDYESGFHYYGARYYWSEILTGWLSVDPMMDKYPGISPYAYCAWNPVRFIDPDGMEMGDPLKVMKVRRMRTSNTFGKVRHNSDGSVRAHQGIDYYAPKGTPVYAVKDGTIVAVETQGDYGKIITLEFTQEDGSKAYAFYAHLSAQNVQVGQTVKEGDEIGLTGNTGNAKTMTGDDEHLHFEYRTGGKNLGKGLTGREDPNLIVDTKFKVDPNNPDKVVQFEPEPKCDLK